MFNGIRDLGVAIMRLAEAASAASGRTEGTLVRVSAVETRLGALETALSVKLAEAEALMIAAKAEKKIARNAENRLHTLEAKRAADADFLSDGQEGSQDIEGQYNDLVSDGYETRDDEAGLPALHEGMEVPRRLTRRQQAYQRINRAIQ